MRVLPIFIFALMFLAACKPNTSSDNGTSAPPVTEIQKLENQVMAIHDEVMPKMKDINDLSAQLRAVRSSLKEGDDGKLIAPVGLDDALSSLKLAEQAMWDWMKAFSDTKATLQEDQLKGFYEKELEKITKVKEDMLGAIEKAKAWLAAYPKQ